MDGFSWEAAANLEVRPAARGVALSLTQPAVERAPEFQYPFDRANWAILPSSDAPEAFEMRVVKAKHQRKAQQKALESHLWESFPRDKASSGGRRRH
jgi:hypothetical protein